MKAMKWRTRLLDMLTVASVLVDSSIRGALATQNISDLD
jgi:hypothetical protein